MRDGGLDFRVLFLADSIGDAMKRLLVTGFFLLVLTALMGAGLISGSPEMEPVAAPDPQRIVPDAHFTQYAEHLVRLEHGVMDCR